MLFYEPLFLFVFAPAVYLLYLLFGVRREARSLILILASVFFYGWSEPTFIFLVFGSIIIDLVVGERIHSNDRSIMPRKLWLMIGVATNLLILIYFKYTGFIIANIDVLARSLTFSSINIPQIALPIGVSFIVFEKITYLVDIYRGVSIPAQKFSHYLLYVFFFPKLLAGPIIKYHDIARQFDDCRHADRSDFLDGFSRFMLGVIKKVLLADCLATGADLIFSQDSSSISFINAWLGVILFTLQIYFDFSGYSDMAIGLARMFGFRLLENFNMPYVATSITDFWRRWHMSLTSWIREYLYFPLGGNRCGERRTYINLWICFLASGVWHGAAWPYVFWGAYNGVFLILDRLFLEDKLKTFPAWLANLITMLIVMAGWTIFRAHSLSQASDILLAMMQPWHGADDAVTIAPEIMIMMIIGLVICIAQRICESLYQPDWRNLHLRYALAINSCLALLFIAALAKGLADPFKPFIYFRF